MQLSDEPFSQFADWLVADDSIRHYLKGLPKNKVHNHPAIPRLNAIVYLLEVIRHCKNNDIGRTTQAGRLVKAKIEAWVKSCNNDTSLWYLPNEDDAEDLLEMFTGLVSSQIHDVSEQETKAYSRIIDAWDDNDFGDFEHNQTIISRYQVIRSGLELLEIHTDSDIVARRWHQTSKYRVQLLRTKILLWKEFAYLAEQSGNR